MNDRYLYRGRSVDNGAWVEGNRIDDGVTGQVFIHAVGNSVNESDKVGEEGCLQFVAFEVDPSTICQCTGLKDKNGKLIWENDIVTGWFDGKRITGYIMYGSNAIFFIERKGLYGIHLDNSEDWLEVIGNIFDEGSENIGKGAEEN